MSKVSIPTLVVALLVVAIFITYMCTFQVAFYEKAVKVRLGKPLDTIPDPGLKFRWPWPIDVIERYDTRLRTLDTPEMEVKTADGKNVIVGTYALWRIQDPLKFYNRVRLVGRAEDHMRSRISHVEAAVIGQKTLNDFVSPDPELVEQSYEQMLQDMLEEEQQVEGEEGDIGLRAGLARDFGIELVDLGVRRISLPKEVSQEVFKSMRQERKTLAARYREEGKSRAAAIKARAEADANSILSFAETKAEEIKSFGYQASARILAKIQETDRELFEWLRWLDALDVALKERATIFLDNNWPFFEPFVNPPIPAEPSE